MIQVIDLHNDNVVLDEFRSYANAEKAVDEFNKEDKENGEFDVNRYEIVGE